MFVVFTDQLNCGYCEIQTNVKFKSYIILSDIFTTM